MSSTRPYTILDRAAGNAQAEGNLVGWHLQHIADAEARLTTELSAIDAQQEILQARIDKLAADAERAQEVFARDVAWDLWMLRDYRERAPQYKSAKRKSAQFGGYTLGARTATTRSVIDIVDEAYIKTAMPDCVETKLRIGDAKKQLQVTKSGSVIFRGTGKPLPEGVVRVMPGSSTNVYYLEGPCGTYELGAEPPEWEFGTNEEGDDGDDDTGE